MCGSMVFKLKGQNSHSLEIKDRINLNLVIK